MRLAGLTLAGLLAVQPVLAQQAVIGSGVFGASKSATAGMTSPMMMAGNNSAQPSNSAANYASFTSGGLSAAIWASSTTQHSQIISIAGNIKNLRVVDSTTGGVTAGKYTFTLFKGTPGTSSPSATALTCDVDSGVTNPANTCTDTTHTITVAAGDVLEWQSSPSGTPTASQTFTISVDFVANDQTAPVQTANLSSTISNAAAVWVGFGQNVQPQTGSDAASSSLWPAAGTIDKLCIYSANGTNVTGWTANLYHNGVAATNSLSTSLSGAAANSNCVDTGTAETIAAGDTVSVQFSPSGATNSVNLYASIRWTPTTAGQYPLMNSTASALSTGTTLYAGISAGYGTGSTDGATPNVTPAVTSGSNWVLSNLYCSMSTAAGAAKSRTLTVQSASLPGTFPATYAAAGTPGTMTCAMSGASATTGNDTTNTYSSSPSTLLEYKIVPSGTPAAITWYKAGLVAKQQ